MLRPRTARLAILMTVAALGFAPAGAAEEVFITVGGTTSADGELTFEQADTTDGAPITGSFQATVYDPNQLGGM